MYNEFFGFSGAPFHIIPDIDFLFMSPKHKEALSCMEFGLMRDIGLMLITGEIGIGKTTLIQHFLHQVEKEIKEIKVACIFNTNVTPDQMLALILQEFGAGVQTNKKAVAIQALQQFLKKTHSQRQRPFLIIDEAQNLSLEALEEVRLLSNLQEGNKALVQILLVGQPELKTKISSPVLASFSQRVGVSYHLRRLTSQETLEYIVHRIRTVGGRPDLFTHAAIEAIFEATNGIPRAINQLCDNSLVFGYVDALETIDVRTIEQVIDELGVFFTGGSPAPGDQGEATGPDSPSPVTTDPVGPTLHDWKQLETRLDAIEGLVRGYMKDMHNLLKSQSRNERSRTDKLLMAYTGLKLKLDALQKQNRVAPENFLKYPQKNGPDKEESPLPPSIVSKLKAIPKK